MAAASLGTKVAEKRGDVFRLHGTAAHGLPSNVVRISEPGDTLLRGCGDIIPVSFALVREVLLAAGFEERQKSLNGQDYTILEVIDSKAEVSLYVPSVRMTDVMSIQTE